MTSLERANQRLDCLTEIAGLLAGHESAATMFPLMLAVAARTLPLEAALLIVSDNGDSTITGWSAARRGPLAEQDARAHLAAVFACALDVASAQPSIWQEQRFLVLPIAVANRPLFAALQVEAGPLGLEEILMLKAVAGMLAVALDRDRAWQLGIERRDYALVLEQTLRAQDADLRQAERQRTALLTLLAEQVQSIGATTEQAGRLIADLTELASLTRDAAQRRKKVVDVREMLVRGAKRGGDMLASRGQMLTVAMPDRPVFVEADARRLEEVFDTLIQKASARSAPEARIVLDGRVSRGHGGPQLVVTLQAEPPGPATDEDPVPALMIAHRVIDLHGGVLRTVAKGAGPALEITLPVREWRV